MAAIAPTPVGNVQISLANDVLLGLFFTKDAPTALPPQEQAIYDQLQSYFTSPRHHFSIKLNPNGTPFQQRVWQALQRIPVGETRTYGELAKALSTSPRAIGRACRSNPIPIIIPCHRIVGAQGLVGYGGEAEGPGLSIKAALLEHENKGCQPTFL